MKSLQTIGKDIWLCEGGNVSFYGFAYSTRMVVVRLPDGGIWIWSPIDLDEALAGEIAALGPVSHLVSPNKIHHLFLKQWNERFPDAKLWGPASTQAKRADLNFMPPLKNTPPDSWGGAIKLFHFTGSPFMDELVFFHVASSTAILGDLSENFSQEFVDTYWQKWQAFMASFWGIMGGKAPLEWRLSFFRKTSARAARDRLLALSPRQVIMAHGEWQRSRGTEFLKTSLGWLG